MQYDNSNTKGSCIGYHHPEPGQQVEGKLAGIGVLELSATIRVWAGILQATRFEESGDEDLNG